jgi:BTB/POZ domain/Kelch motif/Galactose oxidase, central domain
VTGNPPPGRNGHSATLATDPDDEDNGRIIIIGGWLGTGPLAASDMHVLDISDGGRRMRWYQPPVKGTPPGPCNMHSADYVSKQREVYVFRGGNGREYLNDLHALSTTTLVWRKVETTGQIPQQRANHSSAILDETGELFIFGGWYVRSKHEEGGRSDGRGSHMIGVLVDEPLLGLLGTWSMPPCRLSFLFSLRFFTLYAPAKRSASLNPTIRKLNLKLIRNGTERLNDIHILDTATSTWTCPHAGGVLPHPRAGMTLTALRGRLYLFGGSGTSSKCFQDLQILDREEMAWLDVTQYEPTAHGASRHRGYDHVVAPAPEELHRQHSNNHHQQQHEFVNHNGNDGYPQWNFGNYDGSSGVPMDLEPDGMMSGTMSRAGTFTSSRADWRSRESAASPRSGAVAASPNPNDEDTVPTVLLHGRGPGRRAGHTATAVNRKIYVFGGSCGSDYLNDFYVLDTDPPPHVTVSEPTGLHLIERRLRHFFNDEEFSDVTFIVQGRRLYGHKMILAIVSDCFRAMFTAGFRESSSSEIEITDCSYEAFLAVMEYIYTGAHPNTNASSLPPDYEPHPDAAAADRTAANLGRIVDVLALADRFFLDHLKQICETQLQPYVTGESVEFLLQVAQKTNASQLQAMCEHFLRNREM